MKIIMFSLFATPALALRTMIPHAIRFSALRCVGTSVTPIPGQEPSNYPFDTDNSWKTTVNPAVVPVRRELFNSKANLITFDATNTLIEPSQSIGRWYREALNIACDMQIRLPRPALFTAAFKKVYSKKCVLLLYYLSVQYTN